MLCGRLPFVADSYVALAHQHMYAPLPAFRRWLTENSPALRVESVVARCLEKDRERRYGSARELGRAVEPYRVPDKTLRLPRVGVLVVRPLLPLASSGSALSPGKKRRPLRYANLLEWTLVGCCLGTVILALAYWLGVRPG
jgi:serine/threonine protein kinase